MCLSEAFVIKFEIMTGIFGGAESSADKDIGARFKYWHFMKTAPRGVLRGSRLDNLHEEHRLPPTRRNNARYAFSQARLPNATPTRGHSTRRAEETLESVPSFSVASSLYRVRGKRNMLGSVVTDANPELRQDAFNAIWLAQILCRDLGFVSILPHLQPETFVPYVDEGITLADKDGLDDFARREKIKAMEFPPLIDLALGVRSEIQNYIRFRGEKPLDEQAQYWSAEDKRELTEYAAGSDAAIFIINAALGDMEPS